MSEGCVRILSFPEGDTLVTKRLVVDSQKPAFKDYKWKDTGQQLIFSTRELSVAFDKEDASRSYGNTVLNKLAKYIPNLIGGSADLAPANKTNVKAIKLLIPFK